VNDQSNTQVNAASVALNSQKAEPAVISATRPFYWSVRRELWEHPSIYLAPLAVAGVTLSGFLIASLGRALTTQDLALRRQILEEPPLFAALLVMLAAFIVTIFYCLDALYGERRDRSILFWKSLPVSDLTAVLAKASIPLVAIPLITFAITVATQWLMLLVSTAVLAGSGLSVATLWTHWPQMWLMLLYHLLAVHSLWYAPFYAWMLLVSAWARRTPFLWAFLPLLVCSFVERIAFNTWHFAAFLGYRLSGEVAGAELKAGSMAMDPTMFTPGRLLSSPGLWAGLIFAALCIAAAARLRRYRGPI